MQYMNGFYFCHTPIISAEPPKDSYDCEHIISIYQLPAKYHAPDVFSLLETGTPEWNNCVEMLRIESGRIDGWPTRSATLKQEVVDWLNKNVADSTNKKRSDMPQGWMIYDPYRIHQTTEVSVFFLRRKDAMHFKLVWS